jgi:hypothetical protein
MEWIKRLRKKAVLILVYIYIFNGTEGEKQNGGRRKYRSKGGWGRGAK